MSDNYQKHNWQDNELITSIKLNHIEEGIEDTSKKFDKKLIEMANNSEMLINELHNKISNFLFEVDEEEQTLIFKITDNKNT